MHPNRTLCFTQVQRFLTSLFDGDMHAKRVLSLANATLGVVKTASLRCIPSGKASPWHAV